MELEKILPAYNELYDENHRNMIKNIGYNHVEIRHHVPKPIADIAKQAQSRQQVL